VRAAEGRRVLFLSHTSLLEPLGRSQVLPYVIGLAERVHRKTVLSFGAPDEAERDAGEAAALRDELAARGIEWVSLRRRPGHGLASKLRDVAACLLVAWRLCRARRIEIVHARSHLPAACGLVLKLLLRTKLVFDVRGLVAQEYVDAGHWRPGELRCRLTERAERTLLGRADGIVVLTQRLAAELPALGAPPGAVSEVIPCCVDLARFRPDAVARGEERRALGLEGRTVLAYSGSLGSWYLTPEMLDFAAALRELVPDLVFLVLTRSRTAALEEEGRRRGFDERTLRTLAVAPDDMPRVLNVADAAIAFIDSCPSKRASSPTKYAECLATGIPLVVNAGVGDNEFILERHRPVVTVRELSCGGYVAAARELVSLLGTERLQPSCVEVARNTFGLREVGIPAYARLYARLGGKGGQPRLGRSLTPSSSRAFMAGSYTRA
jgi:glycosyltransferase involved in cell wall biosynthesis